MSVQPSLQVGWCPGALRPMRVGDGLLVRVKPRGNRLTIGAARGLAQAARRFGNGVLNITGRANLQIRGVDEATLPALTDWLSQAGLLDPSVEGEAARNLLVSPLAGQDPSALLDVEPLAGALEDALVRDEWFHRLPAKFNWSVDDGGSLGLEGLGGDVRFGAEGTDGGVRFRVALADALVSGFCVPDDLVETAATLAEVFVALCAERGVVPHRMGDLLAVCGAATVFERAGLRVLPDRPAQRPSQAFAIGRWTLAEPHGGSPPGLPITFSSQAERSGGGSVVGVAPVFGRLEAGTLEGFAAAAKKAGASDLRLTPWRGILVAGLDDAAAEALVEAAALAGLISDPGDPRLGVAVCAGGPACARAGAPVQTHAAVWASCLPATGSTVLHVSGCAKGCAHASAAPLTLVARAGRYDVVRGGRAGDPPVLAGLSVEAVTAMLSRGVAPRREALS